VELPLKIEQVVVVDSPADQAEAVFRKLKGLGGKYRADEIVIGVPDEKLTPDLERRLGNGGVVARWGPGQVFAETPPARLLDAVATFLEQPRFSAFAAVIRHPDVGQWFAQGNPPADWLERLDEYQNHHLPFRVTEEALGTAEEQSAWRQAVNTFQQLLGGLSHSSEQPLSSWGPPIWQLLLKIYGNRALHTEVAADQVVYSVCSRLNEVLCGMGRIPESVMPQVSAAQATRWLFHEARRDMIPATLTADSVEMLGWLELITARRCTGLDRHEFQ
jgi:hypothetical protein